MRELYGQCKGAAVVLHGGAGVQDMKAGGALEVATNALRSIGAAALAALAAGTDPLDVVAGALAAMERDPQFNAGRGATLQADGQSRLTAALMSGPDQRFSGVIGATDMIHPSALARALQTESARVLCPPGPELLARRLGLPVASPVTPERLDRWYRRAKEDAAQAGCDTVGCVVRTADGRLFTGTSTGGRGNEHPGRVSDSGTVAGTYCTAVLGCSATGTGEQIVDDALAARLETRVRDGLLLADASRRCFAEARERARSYGWIALDRTGAWAICHTTPAMSFALLDSTGELAVSWPHPG
jgi:L-asparaginase